LDSRLRGNDELKKVVHKKWHNVVNPASSPGADNAFPMQHP
jgi:hypothetical protein